MPEIPGRIHSRSASERVDLKSRIVRDSDGLDMAFAQDFFQRLCLDESILGKCSPGLIRIRPDAGFRHGTDLPVGQYLAEFPQFSLIAGRNDDLHYSCSSLSAL